MKKINQLIRSWQKGAIKLSTHLQDAGYQKDLLKKYVYSDWLESLGYGAYKLAGDNVEWFSAIKALQDQKKSNVHPGGRTALELKGFTHYLRQNSQTVYIFGNPNDKLPKWFVNQEWKVLIDFSQTKLFDYSKSEFYTIVEIDGLSFKVSTPEMAVMEMLFQVPDAQSFEEAYLIMESLTTLRPKLLQQLLEECNSVKVKRLFMWMADNQKHQWVNGLNLSKIDFGKGKRLVVSGGKLNSKYNITVPRQYEE